MWLTKDKHKNTCLWVNNEPEKNLEFGEWVGNFKESIDFENVNIWPSLKWSDKKPLEVDMVISSETNKENKATLWLTRDKSNELYFWTEKPLRTVNNTWLSNSINASDGFIVLTEIWPTLKWEDDALKIDIVAKPEKTKK